MTQSAGELSERLSVAENPYRHRSAVCEAAARNIMGALGSQFGAEVTGDKPAEPVSDALATEQSRIIGGVAAELASELEG